MKLMLIDDNLTCLIKFGTFYANTAIANTK